MLEYFEHGELRKLLNLSYFKKLVTTNFKLHNAAHNVFLLDSTCLDYENYSGAWREENEFSIYYFYSLFVLPCFTLL